MGSKNILCWNVWGLNVGSHRGAVRELVRVERISLVYLQESKMNVITDFDVMQILGPGFEYFYLPAIHTHGGILVAWRSASWVLSNASSRCFSVSIRVCVASGG
jgi:exonuclease III